MPKSTWTQTRREVARSYTADARNYIGATGSYDSFPGLRDEIDAFVIALPAGLVLDVGTGSGRDGLRARANGRRVVFADAADRLLRELRENHEASGTVCCDVVSLPFADESFAGVIASGVLLHLPRDGCPRALGELLRVLRTGGAASISMKRGSGGSWRRTGGVSGRRWFSYYLVEEFVAMCRGAGFTIDSVAVSNREDWFTVIAVRPPSPAGSSGQVGATV